jgi:hypothetical protein
MSFDVYTIEPDRVPRNGRPPQVSSSAGALIQTSHVDGGHAMGTTIVIVIVGSPGGQPMSYARVAYQQDC